MLDYMRMRIYVVGMNLTPLTRIRRKVFQMSQAAFAEAIGVNQSTVSRWENDELQPSLEEMARIRAKGAAITEDWSDKWFFELPAEPEHVADAAE